MQALYTYSHFSVLIIEATITSSKSSSVLVGDHVSLTCSSRSSGSNVSYVWAHLNSSTTLEEVSDTLTFPSIATNQLGTYQCNLTTVNASGSAEIMLRNASMSSTIKNKLAVFMFS